MYYIHQTPLSSWRLEGGSGDETTEFQDLQHCYNYCAICFLVTDAFLFV